MFVDCICYALFWKDLTSEFNANHEWFYAGANESAPA
jgi:hypothetical protein